MDWEVSYITGLLPSSYCLKMRKKLAKREKEVEEDIVQGVDILRESVTDVRDLSLEMVLVDIEEERG